MSSLLLAPKETTLQSWTGRRKAKREVYDFTSHQTREKETWNNNGVLVMTTQKLLWIDERGIFEKSYHPNNTIDLGDIKGISMGGWLFKYVTLTDGQGSHDFRLGDVGENEFPHFKETVTNQSTLRKARILEEKRKE